MSIVVFGLAISSSWGNGHATPWRGLVRALAKRDVVGVVGDIQVKQAQPATRWVWGGFRMPGRVLHALHALWRERQERDEYPGTLVDAYIAAGGLVRGIRAGSACVDVGTLNGSRAALQLIGQSAPPVRHGTPLAHHGGDGGTILDTTLRTPPP